MTTPSRIQNLAAAPNELAIANVIALVIGELQQKPAPEAYMGLYDTDSNMYEQGKVVLSKKARNKHEELVEKIAVKEDGYIETFLVNETSENVWFDQFRIQSTGPLIVQETYYDPWGLELTGLGYQYGGIKVNRYLYNGKEFFNENDINIYDYGARMYDPTIGRWNVVDPMAELDRKSSPYSYAFNNPLLFIDPDGMFGDFYDERGKKLGTDGNDDGKLFIVTNRQEAKSIQKSRGTTQASSVSSAVELPSAKVRKEMGKAVARSNQPSGDDTKGGFHEEGGIFGTGNKGSDQVIHAKPGGLAIPGVDEFASVDPFSGETSDNYLNEVDGTFPTHPSGRNSAGGFDQNPSDFIGRTTGEKMGDIPTAISQSNPSGARYVKGNHYVLGTGNDRVTIYNGSNPRVATFPLKKFISIGIK